MGGAGPCLLSSFSPDSSSLLCPRQGRWARSGFEAFDENIWVFVSSLDGLLGSRQWGELVYKPARVLSPHGPAGPQEPVQAPRRHSVMFDGYTAFSLTAVARFTHPALY